MMEIADKNRLNKMYRSQLLELAKHKKIPNYSKMNKTQLINAILNTSSIYERPRFEKKKIKRTNVVGNIWGDANNNNNSCGCVKKTAKTTKAKTTCSLFKK